ncbi:FUN14 domain-containing protein 2-like [Paramacrobiotus metropolitanus]|uniref:FUN14 domain-containing protein 2-like n=1 Tax=Paramacrobiotus metropolitanus TaxID=2943436 RepID=UPI002445D28A|nr:FUN14 domain-containing protein 2-like [Paramacrobiotus metropolitanus]
MSDKHWKAESSRSVEMSRSARATNSENRSSSLAATATALAGMIPVSETVSGALDSVRAHMDDAGNVIVRTGRQLLDPDAEEGDEEGPLSLVDRALHSLATASRAQQITAGGATGWLSGYLFNKFGRPVIYIMGSSLIVVLFAEHLGYLTVDWSKFRRDYHAGRRNVEQRIRGLAQMDAQQAARRGGRPWLEKIKVLARTSPYLSGGFIGGILLGLAS